MSRHDTTRLNFSFYTGNSSKEDGESFSSSFCIDEENHLSTLLDKFELLLFALGYSLDGKTLRLVDVKDSDSLPNNVEHLYT